MKPVPDRRTTWSDDMTKARRPVILAAGFAVAALCGLSACGPSDNGEQAKKAEKPAAQGDGLVDFAQGGQDVNEKLLEAIRTKPIKGGEIVPRPGILVFDVAQNGTHEESVRYTNQGDAPVKIKSVATTTEQRGLDLSGACAKLPSIAPGEYCDLTIAYTDRTGRSLDTSIFMTTDSKRTPQVTVSLSINIQKSDTPTTPPPAIVPPILNRSKPAETPRPGPDPRLVTMLSELRSQRSDGGIGRVRHPAPTQNSQDKNSLAGMAPKRVIRSTDPRYDPEAYLWTQSSLPVDRSRILTVDRVIPAVLETPITNVMCNQVIAVIDNDVRSPDSLNILIPHGSRAVGQCQAFADERVNIHWTRIITPDGVSIRFNKALGDTADAAGQGGVSGRLQYKNFDRYGLPLISTSFDILSSVARAMFGSTQESTVSNYTGTSTQTISAVDKALNEVNDKVNPQLKAIIKDIADVREMVVVAGGTRIEIVAQEDIYFKTPYEAVRLADVEYDVRHPVMPPTLYEQPAPSYLLQPDMNGTTGTNTIQMNGRYYTLQPVPAPQPASGQPVANQVSPQTDGATPSSTVYPPSGATAPGTTSYDPNAATGAPEPQGMKIQPSYPGYSSSGQSAAQTTSSTTSAAQSTPTSTGKTGTVLPPDALVFSNQGS